MKTRGKTKRISSHDDGKSLHFQKLKRDIIDSGAGA